MAAPSGPDRTPPPDRKEPGDGKNNPVRHIVRIVVVRRGPGSNGGAVSGSEFDKLSPTDIVVVGRDPASVRSSGSQRRLTAHTDHNRDTVLRVWTESDTIEYQCDEPFKIVDVKKTGWNIYAAPDNPFGFGDVEYVALERPGRDGKSIWVWTSGLLPAGANNQQYKMTFEIDGEKIDPDVVCGNPPPV